MSRHDLQIADVCDSVVGSDLQLDHRHAAHRPETAHDAVHVIPIIGWVAGGDMRRKLRSLPGRCHVTEQKAARAIRSDLHDAREVRAKAPRLDQPDHDSREWLAILEDAPRYTDAPSEPKLVPR